MTIFFNPFPQTFTYDGYIINIGPVGIDSYHLTTNTLKLDNAIPNPANNNCKVKFGSGKNLSVNYKLTNLLGEIVEASIDAIKRINVFILTHHYYKMEFTCIPFQMGPKN